jgi:hypothetical protein
MKWKSDGEGRRWSNVLKVASVLVLGVVSARAVSAQTATAESGSADVKTSGEAYQTFYLTSLTEPKEANDVVNDLRNMQPKARFYYLASEGAISMRGASEDVALTQRVLADVDRMRRVYRLTYTITEMDGSKAIGTQHVALVVATGGKTTMKQGSRVPIVTGGVDAGGSTANSQVQYVDVGLNIEASVGGSAEGLQLRSKVEQSSMADEKSGIGAQDPVIRQTRLEGVSTLAPGKPMVLGSLDIPGTTQHEEIEVVSELVR